MLHFFLGEATVQPVMDVAPVQPTWREAAVTGTWQSLYWEPAEEKQPENRCDPRKKHEIYVQDDRDSIHSEFVSSRGHENKLEVLAVSRLLTGCILIITTSLGMNVR